MKKGILMFTGCAMLLSTASAAYSGTGPYLSLNGGIAMLNNSEAEDSGMTLEFESDPGVALTGAFGYGLCDFFRLETEIAYQKNELDKMELEISGISLGIDNISGDTDSLAGLLNGYFDIPTNNSFTPFVSAGIGFAKVEISNFTASLPSEGVTLYGNGDDGTSLAYQVGAGFNIAFNHVLSLDVKYRYFATVDLELNHTDVDYSSHNVYGGLRFTF